MKDEVTKSIYERLKWLAEYAPTDSDSLKRWYEKSRELVAYLRSQPTICNEIPIRIWQFLSDADIRMKDKDYAVAQDRIVEVFLAGLEKGVVLSGEKIDDHLDSLSR